VSFKVFIYYCALCGGWAAFLVWALVQPTGISGWANKFAATTVIGGILGLLLAGTVGGLDALLNAVGFQRILRVGVCMGVGLLGGVIGGLLGALLYWIGIRIGAPDLILHALAAIGWMMVGTVIGASIGVFDVLRASSGKGGLSQAFRKTINGLLGGFLGGLVGGVLFGILQFVSELVPGLYLGRSSLALGLVILGGSIGLLIGLAQVVLKEAWLRVEAGFRPGRELMLTKEEFTIGRGEGCDLGLFGDREVEKLHARILLKNNRYLLAEADPPPPGGTFLNENPIEEPTALRDGDMIQVGNSVLRFGERNKRLSER
jgi:hypothetical protein